MNATMIRKRLATAILNRPTIRFTAVLAWLLAAVSAGLAQSTLQFTSSSYSVNEAAGAVTLTVQRQGDTNNAVSVDYATADGTATAGLRYTAVAGTLPFGAGETSKAFAVPILNNGFADGTKTFRVILSNPTGGGVLGTRTNATVSIADNDSEIQFRFDSYSIAEDAGAVRIGVVRCDDGELPVTVDYATSDLTATNGVDYTGVTNTLAFGPTEPLKFFSVPILNNSLKQPNRAFRVTLSNPTGTTLGGTSNTTVTIADNDQGFQFESATYTVTEDAGAVLIRVLRGTDETNSTVTVDYATTDGTATSGSDYTGSNGTLPFAPGEKVKVLLVPIVNDGVKESTETFRVTLSNPTGGAVLGSHTTTSVTILDNDPGLGFELSSYSVWEKAGEIALTVVRGNDGALGPIAVDYATVDGTAKAGQDYQAVSGTLEFQANETVRSVTIPILRHIVAGGAATFRVTLSNPTGGVTLGTATTTVAIKDNYCAVVPPFDSQLAIRRDCGVNVLTWTGGGQLQRADRVEGPWQTLAAAQSPYNIGSPVPQTFYRVKHPRPVTLYVPSSYDGQTPVPLVILLHGGGWTGQSVEDWMQFRPLAEARGFLYCYPDATVDRWGLQHWSETNPALDPCTDLGYPVVDDPGFLRRVIEETARRFAVDRKRVYLIGHSSGGFECYRMACEHADLIAAIANLDGSQAVDPSFCVPSEPVNILDIRGTADESAYWGAAVTIASGFYVNSNQGPGAVRTIQMWAGHNGAKDLVTDPAASMDLVLDTPGLDTVVTRYTQHPPGGAVELWTIIGGPHTPTLSSEFAPRVIDWLLAHPKP
jgi:poly(3-hydroxybutyrate) depolymerase